MKFKLTKNQIGVVKNCSNDYLKMLYVTDFLFNKERTKEGLFRVLKETNKTNNIKVKKFYLYLICKFNLNRRLSFLDDMVDNISLDNCEKKEIDALDFIDIYSHKTVDTEEDLNDSIKTRRKVIIKSIGRN